MNHLRMASSLVSLACACTGSKSSSTSSTHHDAAPPVPTVDGLAGFDAVVAAVCAPTDPRRVHDFFARAQPEGHTFNDFACFGKMSPRETVYIDLRRVDADRDPHGPVMIHRMEWSGVEDGPTCSMGMGSGATALEILEREAPHAVANSVFHNPQQVVQETTWKSWDIRRSTSKIDDGRVLCRLVLQHVDRHLPGEK